MADDQEVEALLRARGSKHGDAEDQFAIAQMFKSIFRNSPNWKKMPDLHKEAIDMIGLKMSRILVGDFNYADHWDDIAGYAKVVSKRLPK